jgi:NosR/NirI family nitrous oxide reductase transcriptional regulator
MKQPANMHNKHKRGVDHYLLVVLILISMGISSGWVFYFSMNSTAPRVSLALANKVFPGSRVLNNDDRQSYFLDERGETLGSGFIEPGDHGYGGKVPLFIGIAEEKYIEGIILLPNHETQEFLKYIADAELLNRWSGIPVDIALHSHIDAVSGATVSSDAIINGVRAGLADYLNESRVKKEVSAWRLIQDVLFLAIILASLVMAYLQPGKRLRMLYIITLLLVLGILTGQILSIKLFHGWLANGFSWQTNWYSVVLVILALVMPFLKKPMFYCAYLCPMGAFQELINKLTPFRKRVVSLRWNSISLGEAYLTLIWVSLILGFKPELSYLEPFMVFSYRIVGAVFFLFALIIGIFSLFLYKPWCAVCPTGCLLEVISPRKRHW